MKCIRRRNNKGAFGSNSPPFIRQFRTYHSPIHGQQPTKLIFVEVWRGTSATDIVIMILMKYETSYILHIGNNGNHNNNKNNNFGISKNNTGDNQSIDLFLTSHILGAGPCFKVGGGVEGWGHHIILLVHLFVVLFNIL